MRVRIIYRVLCRLRWQRCKLDRLSCVIIGMVRLMFMLVIRVMVRRSLIRSPISSRSSARAQHGPPGHRISPPTASYRSCETHRGAACTAGRQCHAAPSGPCRSPTLNPVDGGVLHKDGRSRRTEIQPLSLSMLSQRHSTYSNIIIFRQRRSKLLPFRPAPILSNARTIT